MQPLIFKVNNIKAGLIERDLSNGNTALGDEALNAISTGNHNTAIGSKTLLSNTSGNENTATGVYAMFNNATGSDNTASGYWSQNSNTGGSNNTSSGAYSLYANTASNNSAFGFSSLEYNTTGSANTANGNAALQNNTTGSYNTASGANTLVSNTTGAGNTADGESALNKNTTGTNNTASGASALALNNTGSYNSSLGILALGGANNGDKNTAAGAYAGYNNTGTENFFAGYKAGYNDNSASYNTMIGAEAGYFSTVVNGSSNTYVGYFTGPVTSGFTNSAAFGQQATPTASYQMRFGDGSVSSIGGTVGWSTLSDGRFKKNIHEDVHGLDFIKQLQPITYTLNIAALNKQTGADKKTDLLNATARSAEDKGIEQQEKNIYTGFIAQDVETAAKKIGYNFSGVDKPKNENDIYGLRYSDFVVPLVKAVQELSSLNDKKDSIITNLNSKVDKLQLQLTNILQQINEVKATQQLCCANNNTTQQTSVTQQEIVLNTDVASLEQNSPNPFSNNTVIRYYLPSKTNNAQLIITNINGHVIKSIVVGTKGAGQLSLSAGILASGNYFYSLIVDGKKVDTKQMIITK